MGPSLDRTSCWLLPLVIAAHCMRAASLRRHHDCWVAREKGAREFL